MGAGEDPEVNIILQPDGEGPEMAIAQNLSNNLENLRNICGIIPCGRPVSTAGSVTCNNPAHEEWYRKYSQCFIRLSYPEVRRVI